MSAGPAQGSVSPEQPLGWRGDGTYLPLQDDIASVAYWYQAEPHAAFPALPGREQLEIV